MANANAEDWTGTESLNEARDKLRDWLESLEGEFDQWNLFLGRLLEEGLTLQALGGYDPESRCFRTNEEGDGETAETAQEEVDRILGKIEQKGALESTRAQTVARLKQGVRHIGQGVNAANADAVEGVTDAVAGFISILNDWLQEKEDGNSTSSQLRTKVSALLRRITDIYREGNFTTRGRATESLPSTEQPSIPSDEQPATGPSAERLHGATVPEAERPFTTAQVERMQDIAGAILMEARPEGVLAVNVFISAFGWSKLLDGEGRGNDWATMTWRFDEGARKALEKRAEQILQGMASPDAKAALSQAFNNLVSGAMRGVGVAPEHPIAWNAEVTVTITDNRGNSHTASLDTQDTWVAGDSPPIRAFPLLGMRVCPVVPRVAVRPPRPEAVRPRLERAAREAAVAQPTSLVVSEMQRLRREGVTGII